MLSVLFSLQAKKAWGALIAAVGTGVLAKWGIDVSGCAEQVGNLGANALAVGLPGLAGMIATFWLKNKPAGAGKN